MNSSIFTGNWSKNSQVVFSFECSGFSFIWYYERGITFDNEIPLEEDDDQADDGDDENQRW